jgi:DNA integrity scanning protein DisA with diadenylate cyclase activity
MDETIKEFSSIDGAFVIRGDGVVESAGSLIQATDYDHNAAERPRQRGHAAAAAISVATNCISIVVSSSTGQVTLFRRGVMLPLTDPPPWMSAGKAAARATPGSLALILVRHSSRVSWRLSAA